MASIQDFTDAFAGKVKATVNPHVSLEGFRFRLLSFDAYHEWLQTGELKPDGSPKWAQNPDLVFDDTGEKVRCVIELQLVDDAGLATSPAAPFVDNKHYFTVDEVHQMQQNVGEYIDLDGARIEMRDQPMKTKNGFARIETKFSFEFDAVRFE